MRHKSKVKILISTFLFAITCSQPVCSQPVHNFSKGNPPLVISDMEVYKNSITQNDNKKMVLLNKYLHPLVTDFKYATNNNFTRHILYTHPDAYVRIPVAIALKKVQEDLAKKGLGLKVFDAYRPYSVTKEMWKAVPDERYAANPAKGSGHNRGAAVDVTLVNISTGEELPMPTGFDDFSEKAHHNYMNLPDKVLQNRALLKTIMQKHGFIALSTEWWHYSLLGATTAFELLDLSFIQLKKLENRQ